ncbi:hypothetical protein BDN72DRAFT_149598 [Pluteus cervinus]|uniref:Uncharacterized protein n=1 Tax=Pluteus cervinus TaxID=181527 RepID=A0ACD3B770_9AGAR|nr:hypothetical protein BDN72DRAFT_149598 [Pluteus cervinus]
MVASQLQPSIHSKAYTLVLIARAHSIHGDLQHSTIRRNIAEDYRKILRNVLMIDAAAFWLTQKKKCYWNLGRRRLRMLRRGGGPGGSVPSTDGFGGGRDGGGTVGAHNDGSVHVHIATVCVGARGIFCGTRRESQNDSGGGGG